MKYQIGQAAHPRDDDPRFETEGEALDAALDAAVGNAVFAVWLWENDTEADTIYLVYQSDVWKKA